MSDASAFGSPGSLWSVELKGRIGSLQLDVQFTVTQGPALLVGPNGAGKTSLLRAIAGGATPLSGRIQLGDRLLLDSQRALNLPPEQRAVGYVPQGSSLFPHLSVLDNVAFGCPGSGPTRRDCARIALHEMGAKHLAERHPLELSGGEAQRVALARALASQPQGLLLDEPLSALDTSTRRALRSLLTQKLQLGRTPALVVTHDARDVWALGGTILVLEQGRILQQGTARALALAPQSEFVAELFESPAPSRATQHDGPPT